MFASSKFSTEWGGWIALLAVGMATFVLRLDAFGDLEPRSDQAFFAWWIAGLDAANHFMPTRLAGETWFQALARDGDSFLTQMLRPIYNAPTTIFQGLTVIVHLIAAKIFGAGFSQQVTLSIAANALIVVPTMLIFWVVPGVRPGEGAAGRARILSATAAGLLVTFSLHLHVFSGLGHHNFGVLLLLAGTIWTERTIHAFRHGAERRILRGLIMPLLIAQGLALYAYKTNLFILAPATVALLALHFRSDIRTALRVLAAYGVVLAILLAPIVPLIVSQSLRPAFSQGANFFDPAAAGLGVDMGRYLAETMQRLGAWFTSGATYFSPAGLAAGLAGLLLLARQRGVMLPALITAAHVLAWSAIPLFAETGFRTYLYVIPLLAIGIGWLVACCIGWAEAGNLLRPLPAAATVAVALLTTSHLASQLPPVLNKARIADALPDKWERFFAGQGELRPVYRTIESRLPKDAFLMTWGYGLQYLHRIFKSPEAPPITLPALHALKLRYDAGLLGSHIAARKLGIPASRRIYLLVDGETDKVDPAKIQTTLSELFGPAGFQLAGRPTLTPVAEADLSSAWPRELKLYEVRFT